MRLFIQLYLALHSVHVCCFFYPLCFLQCYRLRCIIPMYYTNNSGRWYIWMVIIRGGELVTTNTSRCRLLQRLFQEEIIEVIKLQDSGIYGLAGPAWTVKTVSGESVVLTPGFGQEPEPEFRKGCRQLFGRDPEDMSCYEKTLELLSTISDIPVPKIQSKRELGGKEYLIVEKMRGKAMKSFADQPEELLVSFGIWLAKVHRSRTNFFGNLAKTKTESKARFHENLAEVIRTMTEPYPADSAVRKMSGEILEELGSLPVPEWFCPILPGMSPSLFLSGQGKITAFIGSGAYVAGPRVLDFISLEYLLDSKSVIPFLKGYRSILEVPPLSAYRKVYRYFCFLLGIPQSGCLQKECSSLCISHADPDTWLAQPELFEPPSCREDTWSPYFGAYYDYDTYFNPDHWQASGSQAVCNIW